MKAVSPVLRTGLVLLGADGGPEKMVTIDTLKDYKLTCARHFRTFTHCSIRVSSALTYSCTGLITFTTSRAGQASSVTKTSFIRALFTCCKVDQ